jgi:uncharacterized protein YqeY
MRRLSVLRGLLTEVTNASKTATPIQTNAQFMTLAKKKFNASSDAISEFQKAGREELVEQESAKAEILKEYIAAGSADLMSEEEVARIVRAVIEDTQQKKAPLRLGVILTTCWKDKGLSNRTEKGILAKVVKEELEKLVQK